MYVRVLYIISLLSVTAVLLTSCQEKRRARFEREAREYTATYCPQHLDSWTILDSMVFEQAGAGNLKLYYSLDLDDTLRQSVMNQLGELGDQDLKVVRNSVLFAKYKEAGTDFTYIYHDARRGDKIAEYYFTKKDYK